MNATRIINLSKPALADRIFLLHPEQAVWQEASTGSGGVYDAASKQGLRIVCANCASALEETPAAAISPAYAQCPDCGGELFYVYEFQKEKRNHSLSRTPRKRTTTSSARSSSGSLYTPSPSSSGGSSHTPSSSPVAPATSTFANEPWELWDYIVAASQISAMIGILIAAIATFTYLIHPVLFYQVESAIGMESAPIELARCYERGKGWFQSVDPKKEYRTYYKYAEQGNKACMKELAEYYANTKCGGGSSNMSSADYLEQFWHPRVDYEKAAKLALEAGEQLTAAYYYHLLGDVLRTGHEGPAPFYKDFYAKDVKKAVEAYRKAIGLGRDNAQPYLSFALYDLGQEYEEAYGKEKYPGDLEKAKDCYAEAAELGNSKAKAGFNRLQQYKRRAKSFY